MVISVVYSCNIVNEVYVVCYSVKISIVFSYSIRDGLISGPTDRIWMDLYCTTEIVRVNNN